MPAGNVILRGCLLACNKFREQTTQATNIPHKRGGRKDVRKRKIFICSFVNTSAEIISNSLAVYQQHGSAVAAIPCVEAVFRSVDGGNTSRESIPRESLFRTQTPHTYQLKKLLWAHEKAKELNIKNTAASCTLMQELGETVYFSRGSEENLKITTVDDMMIFKALHSVKKDSWLK